jgi:hypothetical protein
MRPRWSGLWSLLTGMGPRYSDRLPASRGAVGNVSAILQSSASYVGKTGAEMARERKETDRVSS